MRLQSRICGFGSRMVQGRVWSVGFAESELWNRICGVGFAEWYLVVSDFASFVFVVQHVLSFYSDLVLP